MFLIRLLLLSFLSGTTMAATQGTLSNKSSGSFSIRLVIPPHITLEKTPTGLNSEPQPFCIKGSGIHHFSTSVLPSRETQLLPANIPVLVNHKGSEVALNTRYVRSTAIASSHCDVQKIMLPSHSSTHEPVTILLAPE